MWQNTNHIPENNLATTPQISQRCIKSWFPFASTAGGGIPLKAALQSLAPLEALPASLANSKKVSESKSLWAISRAETALW